MADCRSGRRCNDKWSNRKNNQHHPHNHNHNHHCNRRSNRRPQRRCRRRTVCGTRFGSRRRPPSPLRRPWYPSVSHPPTPHPRQQAACRCHFGCPHRPSQTPSWPSPPPPRQRQRQRPSHRPTRTSPCRFGRRPPRGPHPPRQPPPPRLLHLLRTRHYRLRQRRRRRKNWKVTVEPGPAKRPSSRASR